jgi:hypothetical protein
MAKAKSLSTLDVAGHKGCVKLSSGAFTLAVTTRVGPRIIGAFVKGGENLFRVLPDAPMSGCDTGFRLYGGHRLWHSPEAMPRSYAPDNAPVQVTRSRDGVTFGSGVEALTGLEKSIEVQPLGRERFRIVHRLTNRGQWPLQAAPWALSVMGLGGLAVIPQQHRRDASPYAPDRALVLWPYTDLADPRLTLGRDYLLLRQDPQATGPCKIGFNAERGWVAYVRAGCALVKMFEHYVDAEYPDGGCSVESYSCADFCEIETVAPLFDLAPGETAEHVELWLGLAGLPPISDEAAVRRHLEPRVKKAAATA